MIEKCMYCGLEYLVPDSPYRDKSPRCFECTFSNELQRMKLFLKDHEMPVYVIDATTDK